MERRGSNGGLPREDLHKSLKRLVFESIAVGKGSRSWPVAVLEKMTN